MAGVRFPDPAQAHQGAWIAQDGIGDPGDDGPEPLRPDLSAHAHIRKQGADHDITFVLDLPGEAPFFPEAGPVRGWDDPVPAEDRFHAGRLAQVLPLRLREGIHALERIDVNIIIWGREDGLQVRFFAEHKTFFKERVVHPAAVEVVNVHPQF